MVRTFYNFSNRHAHLRDGDLLNKVAPLNNHYHNVVAMPNLKDPVDTAEKFTAYRDAVLAQKPLFIPTFGIMATKRTTPQIVREAHALGAKFIKWIPAGASTNSNDSGVTLHEMENLYPSFKEARRLDMCGLFHMELPVTADGRDIPLLLQELEAIPFAENLISDLPGFKISFEHLSTESFINFVENKTPSNVIGTLTLHHALELCTNVCDLNGNIINPFLHCKPVLKSATDCLAVRRAMTSGNYKKFRFGSDDAPHLPETKLAGIPGIFMPAEVAIPLLVQIFEEDGKLNNLESFACVNQIDMGFYGWDHPYDSTFTVINKEWTIPATINGIVPFMAGKKLRYKIQ